MAAVHIAGHPALDFIGTLSERGSKDVEELAEPADLTAWCVEARLVDDPPEASAVDLAAARALRAAMHDALDAWICGEAVDGEVRRRLNTAATGPQPVLELAADHAVLRRGAAPHCLNALARSLLELIATTDPSQVRTCADETCTHPFLDASRSQRRRWCEMRSCGTRHKQRELRARRAEGG